MATNLALSSTGSSALGKLGYRLPSRVTIIGQPWKPYSILYQSTCQGSYTVGRWGRLRGHFVEGHFDRHLFHKQLESDRELSNREREMAFRKEIYTAAAGAIALSMGVFYRFSELSFSTKEISAPYLENSHTIAKVNLVAGEETIRALVDFGTEFSGAFLRLSQQRIVLDGLQQQIAERAALVQGFEKTRDAMIELMRHHNIEGIQDDHRFQMLQDNFGFRGGSYRNYKARTHSLLPSANKVRSLLQNIPLFAISCIAESKRVNLPLIPLLSLLGRS